MKETMGIKLNESVDLHVAATLTDYEAVLAREFELTPEEAQKIAAVSGGWSGGWRHTTAINGSAAVMKSRADRVSTTAHELFHQVQYELSEGSDTDQGSLFWLEEGSADYIGALTADKLGVRSLSKWERDTLAELRAAPSAVNPGELLHCDLARRQELMQKKYHAYQISDQMVWYLLSRQPSGEGLKRLTAYFRALAAGQDGKLALQEVFGVSQEEFLREFDLWYREAINKPGQWLIESREGVAREAAPEIDRQFTATKELLRRLWGIELKGEYHLILAADADDLTARLTQECSIPPERAKSLAVGSLWVENGSTVVINADELKENRQIIFSVAVMETRLLISQLTGAAEDELEWFNRGIAYLMGIRRLSETGMGTMAQYRYTWETHLRGENLPTLAQLMSTEDYLATQGDAVTELTELATLTLAERYGYESLIEYLGAARNLGSYREAFRQVYGFTPEAYSGQFRLMRGNWK